MKQGRPPLDPNQRSTKVSLVVSPDILDLAQEIAHSRGYGVTASSVLREMLDKGAAAMGFADRVKR